MSNISQEEVKLFKSITNSDDPTATRYLERYHDVNTAISNYFAEQESNKKSRKSATNDYDPKPNRKKIGKSTTVSKETKVTQVSEGNSSDSKDFMFLDSNMEEEKQAKPKKVISNSSKPKKLDDTTSFFMGATGFDENTTTAFLLCLLNTALKSPKIQYNMKNRQNNSKSNNNSVKNPSNNNTSLFSREVKSKKDEKTNIYRPSSSKNLALRLRGSYNGYMKKYNKESGLLGDKTPEWPKYLGSAVVECHIVNQDLLMKIKARDEIHFEPEEIDYNSTNVYKKTKGGGRVVSGKRWTIKSTSLLVRCLWSGMFLGYLSCKHEEMFVFLLNRKYVLLEGLVVDNVEHFTGVKLYSTKLKLQIDVFLTKEVVTNPLNIAPIRRKAGRGLKVPDGDELESKRDQQRQQVLRYSKEALTKLFKMMKLRVTIATMVKAKQKVDLFHRIEKEKSEAASKPRSDYCGGPKGSAAEVITEDFAKYYALQAQEEEQRKNVENQFNGVSAENQSLKPPPKKHIMIHSDGSDSSGYEDEDDDNVSDGPDNNDRESRPLNWVTGRSGKGQADLRNGVVNEAPVVEEEGEKNKQNQDLLNTNHISSYYITTEPPKALKTSMHPYQKQALSWMIYREGCLEKEELFAKKPDEQRVLNDLFQEMELLDGCKLYFNPFNGEVTAELPVVKACKGGILADEMGLGKTVMAISLLHKHQRHRTEREVQGHLNWLNDEEEDEDDKKEERKVIKAGNKAKGKTMIELEEEEEEEEDENGSDDYSDQEEEIKIKNELKKARKSRTTVGKKKGKGDDSDEDFEISDEEEYMPYRDQTLGKRQLDQKISLSEEDEKQEPEVTKKVKDEKSTKVELKRRDSFDDLIDDLTSRKSNKLVVEEPKSASKKALNKAQTTISKAFDYKSSAKTTTKNAEKPTNIFNSFKFAPKPTKPAEEPKPNPKDLKVEKEKREKKQKEIVKGLGKPAGTLIVVPVTVLGQWESEIHKHSRPGSLSVFQYYGSSRKKDITKYDVVLTTYGLVESEYKQLLKDKTKSKLFECEWFRIILDEAHYIRTRQAKTTKAVCALMAEYRWCLTGTPLQNKLDDMYSLFQFLKMDTWGEYFWWNSYINKHTSNEEASHLIRSILKPIILRRTKTSTYLDGKSILALPPKEIKTHMVKLSQEERSIYQRFFQGSQKQFNDIVKQGSLQYEYAHIFELILRLRQVCDHPCIVFSKEDLKDSASIEDAVKNFLERKNQSDKKNSKSGDSKEAMDTEFLQKTLKRLKSQDFEPCSICLEEVTEPAIANCGHIFCKECLELSLKRSKRCPLCQKEISAKDVMAISLAENENNMDLLDVDGANFKKSSKLEAVLDAVHKVGSKGEKVVIFSQFVTMLNLMEKFMKDEGVVFRRIDGSCTLKQRERSIQEFNTDKRVTVFLISLKAGAIGLNLTVATNVFLVDPWWNPAVEDQAIERVHRIGQEKNVNVIRFICEKTIEERIQELKQRKKEMIKEVLQFNPQEQKKQNIENMIYIMRGFDDEEEENRR